MVMCILYIHSSFNPLLVSKKNLYKEYLWVLTCHHHTIGLCKNWYLIFVTHGLERTRKKVILFVDPSIWFYAFGAQHMLGLFIFCFWRTHTYCWLIYLFDFTLLLAHNTYLAHLYFTFGAHILAYLYFTFGIRFWRTHLGLFIFYFWRYLWRWQVK